MEEFLARFPEHVESILRVFDPTSADQPSTTLEKAPWQTTRLHEPVADGSTTLESERTPDIPGFTILEELGRGGVAVVYKASRHHRPDAIVAMKILRPNKRVSDTTRQLFLREASAWSRLRHKRIVEFYEVGMVRDEVFMIIQYVNAIPWDDLLADRQTPEGVQFLCGVICQTLQALAYIHEQGIVHRDVKPSNILVAREKDRKRARLADFGLAKSFEGTGLIDLTGSREFRGTLAYVAPEQLESCRDAGPSADIYSTGATLYRLLAGKLPFRVGPLQETFSKIAHDPPEPLSSLRSDLPDGLVAIVERAMAKSPRHRYQTASEMYAALLPYAKSPLCGDDSSVVR
jgi:serine/threonine protein kinase